MNFETKFTWTLTGIIIGVMLAIIGFYAWICQPEKERAGKQVTKLYPARQPKSSEYGETRTA